MPRHISWIPIIKHPQIQLLLFSWYLIKHKIVNALVLVHSVLMSQLKLLGYPNLFYSRSRNPSSNRFWHKGGVPINKRNICNLLLFGVVTNTHLKYTTLWSPNVMSRYLKFGVNCSKLFFNSSTCIFKDAFSSSKFPTCEEFFSWSLQVVDDGMQSLSVLSAFWSDFTLL